MRAFMAPFYARGDTRTPVIATLLAAGVNIALKIALMDQFAQVGLAFATSVGGWVNLALLIWFARRQGILAGDAALMRALPRLALATLLLAGVLYGVARGALPFTNALPVFREETRLFLCLIIGGAVYAATIWLTLGRRQLRALVRGG